METIYSYNEYSCTITSACILYAFNEINRVIKLCHLSLLCEKTCDCQLWSLLINYSKMIMILHASEY